MLETVLCLSLSSFWIRDCWIPEKMNEDARIISHLKEWPGQPKASRIGAHFDSQGLYFFFFLAKLSNKNILFPIYPIHISHSCFQLTSDLRGIQNKVICV